MKTNIKMQQLLDVIEATKQKLNITHLKLFGLLEQLKRRREKYGVYQNSEYESDISKSIMILPFAAMVIDYILSKRSLEIIYGNSGFVTLITIIGPVMLNIIEVIVASEAIALVRAGRWSKAVGNIVKYLVFLFITAMAIVAIAHAYRNYDPAIDGPQSSYLLQVTLSQLCLLIFSLLLHKTIIAKAEEIAASFSSFLSVIKIKIQASGTARLERLVKQSYLLFKNLCAKFHELISKFKRQYPEIKVDFSEGMSLDLINAINKCMGRIIIGPKLTPPFDDAQIVE